MIKTNIKDLNLVISKLIYDKNTSMSKVSEEIGFKINTLSHTLNYYVYRKDIRVKCLNHLGYNVIFKNNDEIIIYKDGELNA